MAKTERQYGKGQVAVTGYTTQRIKKRFRLKCAREGVSMSEKIVELIEQDLKRK